MPRNVGLKILRGVAANIPVLQDGEFYLTTDTANLYVGLGGINYRLGVKFMAAVEVNGNANPTQYIEPNADGSINIKATSPLGVLLTNTVLATTQQGGASGLIGDVQAKGVQGVNALMTQDFKDTGRTPVILYVDRAAGLTTEALVTMTINKGGVVTTGTAYTVTAGKTLRIQSINAEILNTTTVANRVLIRLRSAASVLVTSPIFGMAMAASQAALAASGDTDPHSFPEGIEIAGGQQVGFSQLCTVTTAGIVSAIIVGYEY